MTTPTDQEDPNKIPLKLIICPKCLKVPRMLIETGKNLKIDCECCYQLNTTVKEYLNSLTTTKEEFISPPCSNLNHSDKQSVKYCPKCTRFLCQECFTYHEGMEPTHEVFHPDFMFSFKCEKHKLKYTHFCVNCKTHCCKTCLLKHEGHNLVRLDKMMSAELETEIAQTMQKGAAKLNQHYKDIKDKYIEIVKSEIAILKNKIETINVAYNECFERNQDLLKLFEYFYDNYLQTKDYLHYNAISNLQNHYNFNLKPFNIDKITAAIGEDSLKQICNYYSEDNIIKYIPFFSENKDVQINLKGIQCIKKMYISKQRNTYIYQTQNKKVLIGDDIGVLRVVNIPGKEIEYEILNHKDSITYISEMDNGNIITTSNDETIKIWKPVCNTYECQYNLHGHKAPVLKAVEFGGSKIISCSMDKTIKIWSNKEPSFNVLNILSPKEDIGYPTSFHLFSEKVAGIDSTEYKNDLRAYKMMTIFSSGKVVIWGMDKMRMEKEIETICSSSPNAMTNFGERFVLIGGRGKVWVYDIEEEKIVKHKSYDKLGEIKNFKNVNEGGFICLGDNFIVNYDKNFAVVSRKEGFNGDFIYLNEDQCLVSLDGECLKVWKC
ncbi:MAG: hypothetical protein MJ252_11270 [archaeon]|nr:hypothetical protein [archaeon]